MTLSTSEWAAKVLQGDVRAISRAITAIENHSSESEALLKELFPHTGTAYLTGITGAPGTGKSTLVDRLAAVHRKADERVGVIAVDPTSPYTGGAILGDRIRMQSHASDDGIVYPVDGDAGISGRVGTLDGGSGVAAGCGGEAASADRDGGRGAGRN